MFLLLFQQAYLRMITQSQSQLYTLNMKQINIIMQNTKRTVFITGASKGIGKGIAKVFGLNGYNLFIASRNNIEGETCKKQLIDKGFNCQFMAADVSKLEQMKQAAKRAVQIYGGIDVLCANAGIYPQCTIQQMKQQDFDEIMNINMKGTLFSVQSCLEYLKKCPSKHPRIVITSSITGPVTGSQGWSHYGATKSAQLGFMRTASLQLAKHGITVNAVLPGNIQTQGLTQLGEQYCEGMKKSIPLGRLGKPEDVGHAAVFFASVQASFVTGQSLIVDGGQILPQCKK